MRSVDQSEQWFQGWFSLFGFCNISNSLFIFPWCLQTQIPPLSTKSSMPFANQDGKPPLFLSFTLSIYIDIYIYEAKTAWDGFWNEFQSTCCKEKAVLVTTYIEKPRTRSAYSNRHHCLHHTLNVKQAGKGYINRRAELLHYSHCLRESASTPLQSTPVSVIDHQSSNKVFY